MKKIAAVVMALGLISSMPAFAEHAKTTTEHESMMMDTHEGMRACALQAETIQQKIRRIEGEIKKGSTKYSAEELKTLEDKLKDANDLLDNLGKR